MPDLLPEIPSIEVKLVTTPQVQLVTPNALGLSFQAIQSLPGEGGITQHNNLSELQGGQTDEFYHLSYSDYNRLTGIANKDLYLTGSNLYNNLTELSGQNNLALAQTGQNLYNIINDLNLQTGSYATTLNLTQTGVNLGSKINSLSGYTFGISGVLQNAISNAGGTAVKITGSNNLNSINITGLGIITTYLSENNLYISGNQNIAGNNGDGVNLSGNLTQTGINLGLKIDSLSGWSASNSNLQTTGSSIINTIFAGDINLSGRMALTGSNLYILITGLSGQANINLATSTNLTQTGIGLSNFIIGGDINISGNLTVTGSNIYKLVTGFSGQANINYSTIINLQSTGQNLYNITTGLSGQLVSNLATQTSLIQSGVNLINYINGQGTNLSGNLTNTGQTLLTAISNTSGVLMTQISSASAGVANLNGVSGILTLTNTGNNNLYIVTIGQRIFVSGSGLATSGDLSILNNNLGSTGNNLYVLTTGLSGQNNLNFTTLTNTILTGQTLINFTSNIGSIISGNLTQTGISLTNLILGGDTNLSGRLGITGSNLYTLTTGLSGQFNTNFSTIINLQATGQSLFNIVTGLSGQANINFATTTNLNQTGINLVNYIIGEGVNLSGGLTLTGQILLEKTNSLSGFTTNMSGALAAQIAGGNGTSVKVTGSSTLTTANLTGLGSVQVSYNGTSVFISGSAGGVGSDISLSSNGQILLNKDNLISGDNHLTWNSETGILNINNAITLSNNPLAVGGQITGYLQVNIRNSIAGSTASSDYVITSDIGNDLSGYLDLGLNNSNYNESGYSIGSSGDGYLYVNGGNLSIGTQSQNKIIRFHTEGTTSGNLIAQIDSTGIIFNTGKAIIFTNDNRFRQGNISLLSSGIANKPLLSIFDTGWGPTYLGPALYDKQAIAILPGATTSQTVIGDTAANVGTLSTVSDQILGKQTLYTPAAGLSAGTSSTTASIYRGSVIGRNGFFFTSKFSLYSAWASGKATSTYAAPSGCRIFIGLTDQAVATQVGLNEPAGSMIGLNYLWASGGAVGTGQYMQNWAIRTRNNSATTTGTTTMNFATGQYRFSMYCKPYPNNDRVWWQLDDLIRGSGITGMETATLPVNSTALRPMAALGFVSGIKTIATQCVYVETQSSLFD